MGIACEFDENVAVGTAFGTDTLNSRPTAGATPALQQGITPVG
ncbi:MAG: hypothetical protein ABSF33_19410 [Acidimicrobiales bacterium]|jgi:hypothetical protein